MTRIEFWSAVMGLLVAMMVMFNQMNGRIDQMNGRIDRLQADTNARFDAAQVENSRQHNDLNRRFDEMFEVLRAFERRISHLEGRLDAQGGEVAE